MCRPDRSSLFLLASSWLWLPLRAAAAERPPAASLSLPPSPPAYGYQTERLFPSLTFSDPVAFAVPSGETNRLFIVEQRGRIAVIANLAEPSRSVFLDIASRVAGGTPTDERGLLGLAFHPGYATNGQFFVFYSAMTNGVLHERLSRFHVSASDSNVADPDSEVMLIAQRDDAPNHNGGDLHFGPDGYLYVSLGDEGGQRDSNNNSQRIDKDFFSGILRIDVDRSAGSLTPHPHPSVFPGAYGVPPDNPWIAATEFNGQPVDPAKVRTEFWAVGLRNPWRMSFDPYDGTLWVGDVGQDAWEEVDVITRGGNYGWAYREAGVAGPKAAQAPQGFTSVKPVTQYPHGRGESQGNSVTGGVVYRGQRLSQLSGAYVFADYVSGNIWAVRSEGSASPPLEHLTSRIGIAGFGVDPRSGDILLADQASDGVWRLTYSADSTGPPLPPTLAETGAFTDLATLTPVPGLVPYDVNVPFWSDGALKERWFSIASPPLAIGFRAADPWSFPVGSTWVKHFEMEMTNGVPASRRRLETRFIVLNDTGVYGVTYRWTDPPTNAVLVPEAGLDEPLVIHDATGGTHAQIWHYPGRAECLQCHTPAAGWVLGFRTAQLNRNLDRGNGPTNLVAWLFDAGYFNATSPPPPMATLPALAPASDASSSVEWRVRSWLDANCSQCHRPGGTALGGWDARASVPLSQTGLINGALNNNEGVEENRLIVPGAPGLSMIHSRVSRQGTGRMPPLASNVVDTNSVALLEDWITEQLPAWESYATWQVEWFGSTNAVTAAAESNPDGDGAANELEYLTGTDPTDAGAAWQPTLRTTTTGLSLEFAHLANRRFLVETTDTLARPDSWQALDVPGNQFQVAAADFTASIPIPATDARRFYRVRVMEP